MASAAELALSNLAHGHLGLSFYIGKDFGMTDLAFQPPCVYIMREQNIVDIVALGFNQYIHI